MHDVGRVSATPALRAKLPAVWLPLLSHGQLPYPGSIKDRPKYLLSLSRSSAEATVKHQPEHSDVGRAGSTPRLSDYESQPAPARPGKIVHIDAANRLARSRTAPGARALYDQHVRHEALDVRGEVEDLPRLAVAAAGLKLGAA